MPWFSSVRASGATKTSVNCWWAEGARPALFSVMCITICQGIGTYGSAVPPHGGGRCAFRNMTVAGSPLLRAVRFPPPGNFGESDAAGTSTRAELV